MELPTYSCVITHQCCYIILSACHVLFVLFHYFQHVVNLFYVIMTLLVKCNQTPDFKS